MIPVTLPTAVLILIGFAYFGTRALFFAGGATLFVSRTDVARRRRVYRRPYSPGQLKSELKSAVMVVAFDAIVLTLVSRAGLFQPSEITLGASLATFALMCVWLEVWFYATHRLMHTRALYWLHAQHHVARVTHPLTSLSFGVLERVIIVGGAVGFGAIASHFMPITLPGFGGYFLLNYAFNVWGHTNVELLPESYGRSRLSRIFISVSFHAMHHARYTGHYGLFTTVLDRAFGTYFPDYPEVHARAARGLGLQSLGERASTPEALDVLRSSQGVRFGQPGLGEHV
jgi:Delta7-sterol 5-desaturase